MNILIIGNGGREAAIAHFLQSNSNKSHQIHVSPHMQAMHTVISSQILPKEHQKILEYVKYFDEVDEYNKKKQI